MEPDISAKKKGKRLTALGVALLFLILFLVEIILQGSKKLSMPFILNSTISHLLFNIVFILIVIITFVLSRNIIKIYLEKRKGILGSHFKAQLMLFFIGFSIIPTILMFVFASDLISRNIETWFTSPIDDVMNNSKIIGEAIYKRIEDDSFKFSEILLSEIIKKSLYLPLNRREFQDFLKERMTLYKLDFVNCYVNEDEIVSLANANLPLIEWTDIPSDAIKRTMREGRLKWIDELGKGELIRCGISTELEGIGKLTIFSGIYIEEGYSNPLKKISSSVIRYQQMKLYKDPTRTSYLLILLLVASLLIFSASWLGIHLARTITTPVERLARATEEITKGNLEIQVEPPSTGEIRILTESFNKMVKELKENQEILFQKTKELENRAQFIETVLANVPAGVVTIDDKGLISSANSASLKMLNLPHDVIGKGFKELFGNPPYEEIKNYIDRTFKGRYKLSEKELIIQMDGKTYTFALNITPFTDSSSNFLGVILVLEDLSQFVMMQKLAAWREIAQRVAHEIKNPLTPIQLSAERIIKNLEKKEQPDKSVIEEGAKAILRETATIKNLVSEFSKFARMPSAQFAPVNITEIIKSIASIYKDSFKDIEFIIEFDPDAPENILADYDQIKRAFINIVENAIEAMNGRGKIWIATYFKEETSRLTIEIADNGPGIPPSDRDKLFLPYFSTKKKGRGLGLTIVNEIVNEHKGMLYIEDNKPSGTKFLIEIPV
ncbi:MAG: sensor histidine kinase [Candidatus Aminicenantia bacterium]